MDEADPAQKSCSRCHVEKPLTDFAPDPSKTSGYKSACRACDNAKSRRYYAENAARVLERQTARYRTIRAKAIEIYGGRCTECGSQDELEFDHVEWDGGDHRQIEAATTMLNRIVRAGAPISDRNLQLLCEPCHVARGKPPSTPAS